MTYAYTLDTGDGTSTSTCTTLGTAGADGVLVNVAVNDASGSSVFVTYPSLGARSVTIRLYPASGTAACVAGSTPGPDAALAAMGTATVTVRSIACSGTNCGN